MVPGSTVPLLCVGEVVRRLTWGRLALSDEEGALRVPGSQEASRGLNSRNVLKEPPAAEAHTHTHVCDPQ